MILNMFNSIQEKLTAEIESVQKYNKEKIKCGLCISPQNQNK